jgi:hypothetical protein
MVIKEHKYEKRAEELYKLSYEHRRFPVSLTSQYVIFLYSVDWLSKLITIAWGTGYDSVFQGSTNHLDNSCEVEEEGFLKELHFTVYSNN